MQLREIELDGAHPNTALLTLWGAAGEPVSVQAASVGGGSILVSRVNGMEVLFSGQYTTLIVLHKDAPGTIAAVTELLAAAGVNICNFRLARRQKGGAAVMTIETDGSFGAELNGAIGRLPNVLSSTLLPACRKAGALCSSWITRASPGWWMRPRRRAKLFRPWCCASRRRSFRRAKNRCTRKCWPATGSWPGASGRAARRT